MNKKAGNKLTTQREHYPSNIFTLRLAVLAQGAPCLCFKDAHHFDLLFLGNEDLKNAFFVKGGLYLAGIDRAGEGDAPLKGAEEAFLHVILICRDAVRLLAVAANGENVVIHLNIQICHAHARNGCFDHIEVFLLVNVYGNAAYRAIGWGSGRGGILRSFPARFAFGGSRTERAEDAVERGGCHDDKKW